MYWLVGLFLAETVLEALLCGSWLPKWPSISRPLLVLAAVLLAVTSLALSVQAWQVWLWTLPITGYRICNMLRLYMHRLPEHQLRTVAVRAFGWLLAAQTMILLVAWAVSYFHWQNLLLNIIVSAQLLCAVVLLRATTHTWRHSKVTSQVQALSDKELPTVSVLVPARNETDDLQLCVQTLLASSYPKLEIVVLDDCSANRKTPDIIRSFAHDGVRFIQGTAPDESRWLAKNYAYERLSEAASGELLLFCGVDTLFAPESIRLLVQELEARSKDMISVLPMRASGAGRRAVLLQTMRYYWEIALPRRFFKRPPVLSTCWLIRRRALGRMGGFASVSRSISPEALFARQTVVTDRYSFIRSDEMLGVRSNKPSREQYGTSVRVRYPQLHRRLELVAFVSFFEVVFLIGPLIGLMLSPLLPRTMAYVAVWTVSLLSLLITYGLVAVGARLTNKWVGWLQMPLAFMIDLAMIHTSMWKYEFSTVEWKGRNVCIPVMQVTSGVDMRT